MSAGCFAAEFACTASERRPDRDVQSNWSTVFFRAVSLKGWSPDLQHQQDFGKLLELRILRPQPTFPCLWVWCSHLPSPSQNSDTVHRWRAAVLVPWAFHWGPCVDQLFWVDAWCHYAWRPNRPRTESESMTLGRTRFWQDFVSSIAVPPRSKEMCLEWPLLTVHVA